MHDFFGRNEVTLRYYDNRKKGPVLVYQHGLTGDHKQTYSTLRNKNFRVISLECRGHGDSELGPRRELSFKTFAEDLHELLCTLGVEKAAFAGISMGATLVGNLVQQFPEMATRLIMIRPAWFVKRCPDNLAILSHVADFLSLYGSGQGKEYFEKSAVFQTFHEKSPDNADSLLSAFSSPDPKATVALIRRFITCDPGIDLQVLASRNIPTLVLGVGQDVLHPISLARDIANALPGATFRELFPKVRDSARHEAELINALVDFCKS